VSNRVAEVVTFLRHFNIKDVSVRVRYVEKEVRAYRPDELKTLFAAATPEEWLLFQFYLCTGCREQEVANAHWNEVDYVDRLFRVTAKPNWRPKDLEEREIPVPDYLLAALKEKTTQGDLIFPTADGKRDGHMLRKIWRGGPGWWVSSNYTNSARPTQRFSTGPGLTPEPFKNGLGILHWKPRWHI